MSLVERELWERHRGRVRVLRPWGVSAAQCRVDSMARRARAGARAGQYRGHGHAAARSQPMGHVSQRRPGREDGIDRPCLCFANLAVVAPGIAEALLATAFGLAAAIPAVVIYNVFARSIAGYRAGLGDAAAEVLRL